LFIGFDGKTKPMSISSDIHDAIATQRQIIADLQEYGPASLIMWGGKWTPLGDVFDQHAALLSALEDQARRRGMALS
jgi:hypothetical protein